MLNVFTPIKVYIMLESDSGLRIGFMARITEVSFFIHTTVIVSLIFALIVAIPFE